MIQEDGLVSHYTKVNYLENILAKGQILLSPVKNMDDPRESSLSWIDTVGIGQEFDKASWQKAKNMKRDAGKYLRVFCTAQPKPKNKHNNSAVENSSYCRPRMWSQYGDNFKGFCILFEKEKLIEAIESEKRENDFLIHDSISYPNWLDIVQGGATIEYGSNISLEEKNVLELINHNKMLRSIYFKKGYDWQEEYEYRWLLYSERTEKILVNVPEAIHTVVLGNEFPESKYEEVKSYCENLDCKCFALNYRHPAYNLIEFV